MPLFPKQLDLYNTPSGAPSGSSQATGPWPFDPASVDFSQILTKFNIFVVGWSVFLAFLLMADFYFYYRRHGDCEFPREAIGEKRIWQSTHVWLRYLLCLFSYGLATFFGATWPGFFLSILTILLFLAKFWGDLRDLLGMSDYFDWYKAFTKPILNFLNFKVSINLGKKK